MTSIFDSNGRQTAVTIIEAGPCVVTQKKTLDSDGYNAVQFAFGDKKEKHTLLSEKNHFAKECKANVVKGKAFYLRMAQEMEEK